MIEVRVLMAHIMETGQRKDSAGAVIPAHHIQNVTATWNGKTVLGPALARRYHRTRAEFQFQGRRQGRQGRRHLDRQQG